MLTNLLENLRTHFNVLLKNDELVLTMINSNIDLQDIRKFQEIRLIGTLKKLQIIIIDTPNFDDELLIELSNNLPDSITQFVLDISGCQSLKGSGFLQLFEKVSGMCLKKLHFDFGEIYNINDIVIEGLSMLLGNMQQLESFFLDLYEVNHITQDGYLILAESFSNLTNLTSLHIDLSANDNLNQDSLQLLFSNFPSCLKNLTFRILDIEQIGGGSFYKLAEAIGNMKILETLNLNISTFSNLNSKVIPFILDNISKLKLNSLQLNLSNLNIPSKVLSNLQIAPTTKKVHLDLSCNRQITDNDAINLSAKLKHVEDFSLNLDFCTQVTEDAIEQIVQNLVANKICKRIELNDKLYSLEFIKNAIKKVASEQKLIELHLNASKQGVQIWNKYKQYENEKKNLIYTIASLRKSKLPKSQINGIISMIF